MLLNSLGDEAADTATLVKKAFFRVDFTPDGGKVMLLKNIVNNMAHYVLLRTQ